MKKETTTTTKAKKPAPAGTAKKNRVAGINRSNGMSLSASQEAKALFDELTQNPNAPWKGGSLDGLDVGTSIDELLANPEWNYPVIKTPIKGTATDTEIPGRFYTQRADTGQYLGLVGKPYQIVSNAEVTEQFRPFFEQGLATFESCGVYNHGNNWILARMAGEPLMRQLGDPILPYLCFGFGHNGEKAISVHPTAYRVGCLNAMPAIAADARRYGVKLQHRAGVHDAMSRIMDVVKQVYSGMRDVEETLIALADKKIVDRDSLENFFRAAYNLPYKDPDLLIAQGKAYEESLTEGKRILDRLFAAYETEVDLLPAACHGSYYHAINAVTRDITHNQQEHAPGNRFYSSIYGDGHTTQMRAFREAVAA